MATRSAVTRILSRVCVDPVSDCWLWIGAVNNRGYANTSLGSRAQRGYVHRVIYEATVGPIPDGLVIDHLCRNRRCVNPDHLEPVTNAENVRRGYEAKAQTHCKRGHDLALAYVTRDGRRDCQLCRPLRTLEVR